MSDARVNVVRDRVDFSVRIDGLEDQDLLLRKLGSPRRLVVASPGYLAECGEPKSPAELTDHRLVDFLLSDGSEVLTWKFARKSTVTEMPFRAGIAVSDADARVKLAVDGPGIAKVRFKR